ncbi:MAG: purine-nucleoside phosphorylase [Jiangellaceae bacterium]|nr:purine-nucleoside phosphorylase [Jiangellaceae bacterium]
MTADPATTDLTAPDVDPWDVANAAAAAIADRTELARHDTAVVLGSGLAAALQILGKLRAEVAQSELPGFTPPAVPGHAGVVQSIEVAGRRTLCFGGRSHLYEGRGVRPVVHAVRTAAAAGCRAIVLTNGCGALRADWPPGTAALIRDHINLTATSPLEGPTFVDLTNLYALRLRDLARSIDPALVEGVYVQFRGPHYETPAEVRMARQLGGDVVGMSTALEAIAAREAGLEVLGISLVTNHAAGVISAPLRHVDVFQAGTLAAPRFGRLLAEVLTRI